MSPPLEPWPQPSAGARRAEPLQCPDPRHAPADRTKQQRRNSRNPKPRQRALASAPRSAQDGRADNSSSNTQTLAVRRMPDPRLQGKCSRPTASVILRRAASVALQESTPTIQTAPPALSALPPLPGPRIFVAVTGRAKAGNTPATYAATRRLEDV